MIRTLGLFCLALLISACSAPVQTLSGRVVDATIVVEGEKLRMVDWNGAGQIALRDGVPYQQIPQSSPKPTQEEIAEANAILERNRAYTSYVQRPDILKQAETAAIPALERNLVELPREGFQTNRFRYAPFNGSRPELRLVLYPEAALLSPRTFAESTSADVAGDLAVRGLVAALAGGRSAGQETLRYVGDFELRNARTGNVFRSGRLNARFKYDRGLSETIPHARLFSMMIWDAVLRGATTGPARKRRGPARSNTTDDTSRSPAGTAVSGPVVATPTPSAAETAPPVPGSPPLHKGTSYALFTPEQITAYCEQDWRVRTSPDGRTEYNPCRERGAFAP